ncbi:hypothetical protein GX441_03870 [bacterium]|nr:hypothetical protein [bacterium]
MRSMAAFLLLTLSGCSARIAFRENTLPVRPLDDLRVGSADTTLEGVITMLSDKMQSLDVVEIRGEDAFRRVRILLDKRIEPYYGGIITAQIAAEKEDSLGYITFARLLNWDESNSYREKTQRNVSKLLEREEKRLASLLAKEGFGGWDKSEAISLEGYDSKRKTEIYSMAGRSITEATSEKVPLLVIWSKKGRITRAFLTVIARRLERS